MADESAPARRSPGPFPLEHMALAAIPPGVCRKDRKLRDFGSEVVLTRQVAPPRVRRAPSTERLRLMALQTGSRFGGGQSGRLDEGATDSVHFLFPDWRSGILRRVSARYTSPIATAA